MSRNVRRLLLDVSPLWGTATAFAMLGVAGIDYALVAQPAGPGGATQFIAPWAAFFPSVMFAQKFPAWRALPLSSGERRRAQWWVWIGAPFGLLILIMAAVTLALGLKGWICADPAAIAGGLAGQIIAAALLVATGVLARLLRGRLRSWSVLLVCAGMAAVAAGMTRMRDLDPGLLMAGGLVVLLLAAAAYLNASGLGAALDRTIAALEPTALGSPDGAGWARGWAAMAPWALAVTAVTVAAAVAVTYSPSLLLGPAHAESARRGMPNQVALTLLMMTIILGAPIAQAIRTLRILPLSAAGLTMVLQGFMLAVATLTFAVLWALFRVTGVDTSRVGFFFFAAVPILALRLPLSFRLESWWSILATAAPLILVPFLQLVPGWNTPWFKVLELGLVALIWVWTWWELAYGRGAYRAPHPALTRWRGGA
jgi:hypothetical protein